MSTTEITALDQVPLNSLQPHEAATRVVRQALALRASDLFCFSDESAVIVAARTMGQIERLAVISRDQGRHLISCFKALAGIDIADHRRPQEGRWICDLDDERIDLRINVVPTLYGEDLAARLLDRKFGLRSLDDLGLSRMDFNRLTGLLASPTGMVLVTGPTDSGKTTTLYACVQHLNTGKRKLNTIEDPIEYPLKGIRQSEVNTRIGVDFSHLLKHVLRQAPDVIMIGEIRDEETAATSVRAANSGHLVLATLHVPEAAGAIQSFRAWGANPHFLANCILGVLAQRLVRTLCLRCRVAYDISQSPETFSDIQSLLEPGLGGFIYGSHGCEECRHQGYQGRTGIFELMTINRQLRQMIFKECSTDDIQQEAIKGGMVEFRRAALLKVAQGITTTEEILRELPAEHLGLEA